MCLAAHCAQGKADAKKSKLYGKVGKKIVQ
jgi:hypothetical protein